MSPIAALPNPSRELLHDTLDGMLRFGCPKGQDAPSLPVYRSRYGLLGLGCKKILKNQPAFVREPKKATHQFKEPRLLPDIQKFEKFRDCVMS